MLTDAYFTSEEWTAYEQMMKELPEAFRQDPRLRILTDRQQILEFMNRTGRRIGVMYSSPYSRMIVDLVEDPRGNRFAYERMMPAASGAVVMIPCWEGRYVLLRQFRHAVRGEQTAFPRGFGEKGLSLMENAGKEMEEELGAGVRACRFLGSITPDSGITGNRVGVVLCDIDEPRLKKGYEGIEDVIMLTEEELTAAICREQITDGFTLAAWALLLTGKMGNGEKTGDIR